MVACWSPSGYHARKCLYNCSTRAAPTHVCRSNFKIICWNIKYFWIFLQILYFPSTKKIVLELIREILKSSTFLQIIELVLRQSMYYGSRLHTTLECREPTIIWPISGRITMCLPWRAEPKRKPRWNLLLYFTLGKCLLQWAFPKTSTVTPP